MSKPIDWELIDYYINRYVEEINHGTDGWTRAGTLGGLIYILQYYDIGDKDLGADRLDRITEGRYSNGQNGFSS